MLILNIGWFTRGHPTSTGREGTCDMVNPSHLEALVSVLRTGSFAGAARQLGYTGSAVSQQIAALERETGLVLFERDARGIRATSAAHELGEEATHVFAALAAFDDHVRGLAGGTRGRIRLGSFPSANRQVVPDAVRSFVQEHPTALLELEEGEPADLLPRLLARDLDAALTYVYDNVPHPHPAQISIHPLLVEDLVAVVPVALLRDRDRLTLGDLRDQPFVATHSDSACATALARACAAVGFAPDVRYRSNNYDVVATFVRDGLGVALIPALAASPLVANTPGVRRDASATRLGDGLAMCRLESLDVHRRTGIAVLRGPVAPTVRRFLDTIQTTSTAISATGFGMQVARPERTGADAVSRAADRA